MRIEPEFGGASIVFVGNFNPHIFTPDWFARHDILTGTQADGAVVEVVHSEITIFRMDWLSLRVEQQRFIVETTEAPFIRLCDLTVKTFGEFLTHTPVTRLGINRMLHFSVGTESERNRIGRVLAPLGPWGEWGKIMTPGEGLKRGGLVSMTMQQNMPEDRPRGFIQTTLQPSLKVRENAGIYMLVNDHYEVENPAEIVGCELMVKAKGPNHSSVVAWIEFKSISMLLGADLEETGDPETGWSAVVTSPERPQGRAIIFKIPHHGSKTAHNPDVWNSMLAEDVIAILTPYNRGWKLPTDADVARIMAQTKAAFTTARVFSPVRRRPVAVEKEMRMTAKRLQRAFEQTGAIRLRNGGLGNPSMWCIECLRDSCHLSDMK